MSFPDIKAKLQFAEQYGSSGIMVNVEELKRLYQLAEERGKALEAIASYTNPTGEDGREMRDIARGELEDKP
jgi:hypothetical protein